MRSQEIYRLVESGLARVEEELARQSSSKIELVDAISRYVQISGGKRIRPTLLLLSAKMCGCEGPVCHR
ncbi:MAG TPA: polyprenyl synthetase family protein, partial [Acidobacteriota bacterium]|nr:polyprenyl synthetase family protein [Acidobacteriota bacterium]